MTFDEYQKETSTTAIYPINLTTQQLGIIGICYSALGVNGEAGEIADKVKKLMRDHGGIVTDQWRTETLDEVGDCLWYLAQLCERLGSSLDFVALRNLKKLADRKKRVALHGSGDVR